MVKSRKQQLVDRMTADIMTLAIAGAIGVITGHLANMYFPMPDTLWNTVFVFLFVAIMGTRLGRRWVKQLRQAEEKTLQ